MPDTNQTNANKGIQSHKHEKRSKRGLWLIIGIGAVVLIVIAAVGVLFVTSADRIRFITEFSLTVALATLVAVQAYIYGGQWEVMERLEEQNERLIRASEDNAQVARDAFQTGEAPHFGIAQIAPEGFETPEGSEMGYAMSLKVTFVNGGKTPAWHFHSKARGIIGKTLDGGQSYDLETGWHDLHNTFFKANDSHTFEYKHHLFRYSRELADKVAEGETQIFIVIKAHYMDFSKKEHPRDFRLIWDGTYRNFRDYDAEEQNCKQCKRAQRGGSDSAAAP